MTWCPDKGTVSTRRRPLIAVGDSAAVAALRDLAAGRGDLMAGVAGVLEEFSVEETFLLAAQDFRL